MKISRSECHLAQFISCRCDRCGRWPEHAHMPAKLHGWFCERCCPVCGESGNKKGHRPRTVPGWGKQVEPYDTGAAARVDAKTLRMSSGYISPK